MFKKNDIHSLPFAQIPDAVKARVEDGVDQASAVSEVCSKFIEAYELANKFTWVLPQMKAHFGTWVPVKDEEADLFNGLLTVKRNCASNQFNQGLWFIAQRPRSGLISGQGVRLYAQGEYNNLVPLILSAFRTYQDIPYSAWSRNGLNYIVDQDLYEAMTCDMPLLDASTVRELRDHGLRVQTGAKQGQLRSAVTTSMLYGLTKSNNPEMRDKPKLAVVMLAQIWCAHPSNRTHHMVLDPMDWDNMPEPAISTDIMQPAATQKNPNTSIHLQDFSWMK